jgi:anaerobic selenocysteine-containing dehydrogenase
MSLLYALTGSFDMPGGNMLLPAPPAAPITGEDLPAAQHIAAPIGLAERALGPARWRHVIASDFYRAVLYANPYPVCALVGFGANLLLNHANGGYGREPFKALEFFAHAAPSMTPTAELADVVFPVDSAFGREALKIGFEISPAAQSLIQFHQAVVSPPGEARPDTVIVFDLRRSILERRHKRCLSPSACSHRGDFGGIAGLSRGCASAFANPARQTRRAGWSRQAPRLRHALPQDRTLFRNIPRPWLPAIARFSRSRKSVR